MKKAALMRLVQISDCHLLADPDAPSRAGVPLRRLEAVIEAVNREGPDRVLITGDISHDGSQASYRLAMRAFEHLHAPWDWLAGNHDEPALMRRHHPLAEELDLGGWRILLIETHLAGNPHGELGPRRLAWLAERLDDDDRPTLVAMHHPPLPVGSAWLDAIGLRDRQAFWQTLVPFRQVRGILCGHIHQAFLGQQSLDDRRVDVYGCPATSDQFLPDAETFALDDAALPGFRVLDLTARGLETRVVRVDTE
ncbi:metallophosphoesterase [Halomonas sp.]|uniref:metallophosphoesterase n=1 Tax=Halomonas sp. TaxID=1486246 RepID=UPI00356AB842